jgi:two-component sensor histidine kinase
MALSRAHDLLTRRQWTRVGLGELLAQAVSPFAGEADPAIRMEGPDYTLSSRAALALAMVIHELATNAAKYGALSSSTGRVDVGWSVRPKDGADWLTLTWNEKGGPAVEKPRRTGFGSRLIERSIARDLEGKADLQFLPSGLQCTLSLPLAAIEPA